MFVEDSSRWGDGREDGGEKAPGRHAQKSSVPGHGHVGRARALALRAATKTPVATMKTAATATAARKAG
jgi:hypothetical protein